jgi:hypothetical protein
METNPLARKSVIKKCPGCGTRLRLPAQHGAEGICFACGRPLTVVYVGDNPSQVTAEQMFQRFHGVPPKSKKFIKLPRVKRAMRIGKVESIAYIPDLRSRRGGVIWNHEFGDYGPLRPKSKKKPELLVSEDGKQLIIHNTSGFYFDPRLGIVG